MRNILTIAHRELKANFTTPIAYVVISGFMILSGFFFFTLLEQYSSMALQAAMASQLHPNLNEWVITPFYQTMEIVLIFMVPLLTMRTIAEEKRSGTFELLITSPVTTGEIIGGKVVALFTVMLIMLLLAFIYPLTLLWASDPETLPVFIGLLGIILFSWAFAALGIAISAFAKSQTVAGVISMVILLVFYVIDAPASHLGARGAAVLKYLAPAGHADMLLKGVIISSDLVYFVSIIAIGVFFANRALDAQRWR